MQNLSHAALTALLAGVEEWIPDLPETSEPVVFLRAVGDAILKDYDSKKCWHYEQSFAPYAERLRDMGYGVEPKLEEASESAGYVLYLATRQLEENQANLARCWEWLKPGGWLLASLHNDIGGKRLAKLVGQMSDAEVVTISKAHCRVVAVRKPDNGGDEALLGTWRSLIEPKSVCGTTLRAAPGMFSWRGVDAGSRLLIDVLPSPLTGKGADIGAGWGYLSWAILSLHSGVSELALIEAEKKALDLAEHHAKPQGHAAKVSFHWKDATRPLPVSGCDWIVMNPPAHDLMQSAADASAAMFEQAAKALKSGGRLWLVANRHLPYERNLETLFQTVDVIADQDGFKVLEAVKA